MPNPTTLLEYAQQQVDATASATHAARDRVGALQARLAAARDVEGRAVAALDVAMQRRPDVKRRLPDAETRGDVNDGGDALELAIVAKREAMAEVLHAKAALATVEAELNHAVASLALAQQAGGAATRSLQRATERQQSVDQAKKLLAAPPLADVRSDAGKATTSRAFTKAKARLEDDFPKAGANVAKLVAHARSRLAASQARLDVVAALREEAETRARAARLTAGLDTEPVAAWAALQRADDAVATYVATAKAHLDRALALLAGVVAATALTPGQRKAIVELATKASAAIASEEDLLDLGSSPTGVAASWKARQERRLDAAAKGFDPDRVVSARRTHVGAQAELTKAEAAVAEAQQAVDVAVKKAEDGGNDPQTDPIVLAKRHALAAAKKERDAKQDAVDEAAAADVTDPAIDALVDAEDTLAKATSERELKKDKWKADALAMRTAARDLGAAEDALADAERTAKIAKPQDDPDVQKAQKKVADARKALGSAADTYRSAGKGALDVWEAGIPDTEWKILGDFSEAERLFGDLAKDPNLLLDAQANAEDALVTALRTQADRERQAVLLEAEATLSAVRLDALERERADRLLAALRGDR